MDGLIASSVRMEGNPIKCNKQPSASHLTIPTLTYLPTPSLPPRIVDNLPVATRVKSELRPDEVYHVRGFPVGAVLDNKHFLFNHIRLVISYNEDHSPGTPLCWLLAACWQLVGGIGGPCESLVHHLINSLTATLSHHRHGTEEQRKFKHSRIVGFLVEPYSIKHSYDGTWPSDPEAVRFQFLPRRKQVGVVVRELLPHLMINSIESLDAQVKAMQYTSCSADTPPVNDQHNLMTLEDNVRILLLSNACLPCHVM